MIVIAMNKYKLDIYIKIYLMICYNLAAKYLKKLLSIYQTYFQDVIISNQTIEWDIWNALFVTKNIFYPLHAWLISTWRNVAWILIISKNNFIHSDYDHSISFDVTYRQSIDTYIYGYFVIYGK